ncbi:MAG: 4Fe-4S binding protein [Planctomycetes bacterium]|nr:4Fe-4S binding protein [Planctomycetota bacterium]
MSNIRKTDNKSARKIIKIDESKCTGCGLCVSSCAEGALKIINGKAKLVSEVYCDGLGACLGECPEGALTIEEREAAGFDEASTEEHIKQMRTATNDEQLPCGCPSTTVKFFVEEDGQTAASPPRCDIGTLRGALMRGEVKSQTASSHAPLNIKSALTQWPVQLTLIPPDAPFLRERDLVIAADCVAYAYGNFHQDFLKGKALVIGCPKLDAIETYQDKLIEIFKRAKVKSVTVLHMEVPCCSGIVFITKKALAAANRTDISAREITIGMKGDIKSESKLF